MFAIITTVLNCNAHSRHNQVNFEHVISKHNVMCITDLVKIMN